MANQNVLAVRNGNVESVQGSAKATSESHILVLDNVKKSFLLNGKRLDVLDGISLTIEQGSFVSIVGASGCGKSTLLRLISGLDNEYTGRIVHNGAPITGTSLTRGLLFQDHRLFPWMTVLDNVKLSLINSDLSVDEQIDVAEKWIAKVGLADFIKSYPAQLSGGMSQRAAIARALVTQPEILLLDEPLGALDALTRLRMQQELTRLWREQGITMLMVTHDIDEAVFLSDEVIVLEPNPGRVAAHYKLDLPHPRSRNDPHVVLAKEKILAHFIDVEDSYGVSANNEIKSASRKR